MPAVHTPEVVYERMRAVADEARRSRGYVPSDRALLRDRLRSMLHRH